MAVLLNNVEPRGHQRLRAMFSQALAGGAFTTLTFYAVTSTDDHGLSPNVIALLQIASNIVEFVLDTPLVDGGQYYFSGTSVPAADASTWTGTQPFQLGTPIAVQENKDPLPRDVDAFVFGIDCVWNGKDYQENAAGDLDSVSGVPNAQGALKRRVNASGLPWNPKYGPKLNQLVGAPSPSALTSRGAITEQLLRDDRVASAIVKAILNDDDPNAVVFDIQPTLIGNRKPTGFQKDINA